MPDQNRVFVTGYLTEKPELRTTALKGKSVCNPTLRINDRKKTPEGWQPYVEFVPVVAFGNLAEFISTLTKGTRVRIEGKLQANQFERDGTMVSELQVMAYELDILARPSYSGSKYEGRQRDTEQADTASGEGDQVEHRSLSGSLMTEDESFDADERQPDSNDNRPVAMLSSDDWTPGNERRGQQGALNRQRGKALGARKPRSGTQSSR